MNFWLLSLGIGILALTVSDLVLTTFAPSGSGMITGRLRRWVWSVFLWMSRYNGKSKALNYAGPVTVVCWLFGWILLLWIGNALIFMSDYESVISAANQRSTTWTEKMYFTGYALSTLGSGEFIPYGTGWQLYASFISFSGFIIITISLTYLYSVVTNDINRRKVSLKIYHTGGTPQEILLRFWDGKSFNRLRDDLASLSEELLQVAQNHMAYPVLHNFHSTRREENLVLSITSLDEALTILLLYKPDDVDPDLPELYQLRSSITYYLQTLQNAFVKPADENPPAPDFKPLLNNGLPLFGKPFEELLSEELRLRRRLLLGLLHSQGWNWAAVEQKHSTDPLDNWLTRMRENRAYTWPVTKQKDEGEEHVAKD